MPRSVGFSLLHQQKNLSRRAEVEAEELKALGVREVESLEVSQRVTAVLYDREI